MFISSVIIMVFLMACYWLLTKRPMDFPPGPKFLPIVGNINILKHIKTLKFHHLLWHNLSKLYGPVVGLKFFHKYVVIVSSKEAIKEVYSRDELNGRPDGFFFRIRTFEKRLGVVFTDGHFWENQRRFSATTLKHLGVGKFGMVKHIEHEAEELISELMKISETTDEFPMHSTFDISVLNLMWVLLKGERFELDDQKLIDLVAAVHKNFQVLDMSGGILNLFPAIRHIIPEQSGYKELVDTMRPIWSFLAEEIHFIKETYDPALEPKCFIEAYLKEMSKVQDQDSFFSEEQLFGICIDFFQAGSETTANSLGFAILYMLHHPKVMRRVQVEIMSIVGANKLPKLSDRPKLKYTDAVISEVQRCANIAPLGIAHRAVKNAHLNGFLIPKDATILCNLYSLNMDDKNWKKPTEFMPERFLNDDGDLIYPDYFIPFAMGKRRCLGENVAKSSLFLFFASIVHSFDIKCVGELPDLMGIDGISLAPKPFKVKLWRRF
ncbi:methyl farnesoate epoxidase-like [Chironomus tepperi]|uniref:methyl farnesoate epoxidase-like n=1 Tax=Chironomus tepperi TaxID=113505 RepID=UPI00391F5102